MLISRRAWNLMLGVDGYWIFTHPESFSRTFPVHAKKACKQCLQAFDFKRILGGKCKFRTCDPCSVNAIETYLLQGSHRRKFLRNPIKSWWIALNYTRNYTELFIDSDLEAPYPNNYRQMPCRPSRPAQTAPHRARVALMVDWSGWHGLRRSAFSPTGRPNLFLYFQHVILAWIIA